MDDADRADREDIIKEQAIAAIRRRNDALPGIGYCYYCGAELRGGNRFCDAECMNGWQDEEDARSRNGRLKENWLKK